ncbi:MAG: hypothetical protein PHN69_04610 [Candidatus Pacebacteria bacterium]|nr:hypothetical protein [Fermentimonas sp.]MDD4804436.1 hypothetical protein [Candidatus Paceibacterota bacterium]
MTGAIDDTEIVIKYDQVYTPNPDVCPGRAFPSFEAMKEAVGKELDAAEEYAEAHKLPFLAYTAKCVIKPEFAHEVTGLQEQSE